MLITVEAYIDENNQVRLLQPLAPAQAGAARRALVTIFDDVPAWQTGSWIQRPEPAHSPRG